MSIEFWPLDRQGIAAVVDNEELYRTYVDALMLLQDMIDPYSPARSHKTFEQDYVVERATKLIQSVGSIDHKVAENIKTNLKAAEAIIDESAKINSSTEQPNAAVEQAYAVQTIAEKFVDALVRMYGSVRNQHKRGVTA